MLDIRFTKGVKTGQNQRSFGVKFWAIFARFFCAAAVIRGRLFCFWMGGVLVLVLWPVFTTGIFCAVASGDSGDGVMGAGDGSVFSEAKDCVF